MRKHTKKVKKLKGVRCLCPSKGEMCLDNKDCMCPKHFISLTEWRKHIVDYYNKKALVY